MPAEPPAKSAARRARMADRIAVLLLKQGVAALPLRTLAQALGTSDRMLVYYFGSQAALTRTVLAGLSERLAGRLEQALPPAPLPPAQLFKRLTAVMTQPEIAAILRVWADVAARGARGEQPFGDFARASVTGWLAWTGARLAISDARRREKTAAAILVAIEGLRLLELSAPGMGEGAIPVLAKAFASPRDTR